MLAIVVVVAGLDGNVGCVAAAAAEGVLLVSVGGGDDDGYVLADDTNSAVDSLSLMSSDGMPFDPLKSS